MFLVYVSRESRPKSRDHRISFARPLTVSRFSCYDEAPPFLTHTKLACSLRTVLYDYRRHGCALLLRRIRTVTRLTIFRTPKSKGFILRTFSTTNDRGSLDWETRVTPQHGTVRKSFPVRLIRQPAPFAITIPSIQ